MAVAKGLSLDTGALLAIERRDQNFTALIANALQENIPIHVVAEVVAQAWRGGARQAPLAKFLKSDGVDYPQMSLLMARAVGELCGRSNHHDIVDVFVAMEALMARHTVVTSDPEDLRKVDPRLPVIVV